MIAYLRGRLESVAQDHVILDVGGVGYRVFIPQSTRANLPAAGRDCRLHTHLHVREDSWQLFGFATVEEHHLFELMLTVNGVGPKLALSVLSSLSVDGLRRAVTFEDTAMLTEVPGIGRKTAGRLVLELKDKIGAFQGEGGELEAGIPSTPTPAEPLTEAMDALTALGYTRAEAGWALEKTRGDGSAGPAAGSGPAPASGGTEALVRSALKHLSARRS